MTSAPPTARCARPGLLPRVPVRRATGRGLTGRYPEAQAARIQHGPEAHPPRAGQVAPFLIVLSVQNTAQIVYAHGVRCKAHPAICRQVVPLCGRARRACLAGERELPICVAIRKLYDIYLILEAYDLAGGSAHRTCRAPSTSAARSHSRSSRQSSRRWPRLCGASLRWCSSGNIRLSPQ